jgi:NTP pyrophosphatase (non-canonical NTP hydrolase)
MSMTRVQLLLGKVAEECNEVAQRALKAQQFGLDDVEPGKSHSNRKRLMGELTDLHAVLLMLEDTEGFNFTKHFDDEIDAKKQKVEKFILLSQSLGMVEK